MDHTPLYKQLKNKILDDIVNQVYQVDDMIPSQFEYAEKYGVSRVTVRQAINELVYNGVLYTQKGKGTFVKSIPVQYRDHNRLHGFTENIRKNRSVSQTKVLEVTRRTANQKLAQQLRMSIGQPIMHLKRIRYADGIPLALEDAYLNEKMVCGIDFFQDVRDNVSLYRLIREKTDIRFHHAEEAITAVLCGEEASMHLNVRRNDPILFVRRLTYVDEETPFEYCENVIRSDVHSMVVRFNNTDY
ncbi:MULTISPECIES: GntR family transcriptional regulator [unclassified Paenibacillus]|uniref:GntR family transcriptional regulator n=1 Tax=unclassified Paenibacillus TaxID=185978 RepID=UPI001C0FAA9F|nr:MULTISPECIES: GntR family transcriptional regulator [unclassified Paenibacillus]MBU5443874.1 GntR family transcriptional regulator [Paenibacillus sp. MSJ-34]CAH0122604.1 HTH-type transcriptional repressor GamR [Paenibacillus sp. CECT 9249]